MEIYTDLSEYKTSDGLAVTIGNFDGVHLGHKRLIEKMSEVSDKENLQTAILTFHPHPLKFFKNDIKLINSRDQKIRLFEDYRIDKLFMMEFNDKLASIDPETFIREYLVEKLKAKYIIIGYDYHFGRKRKGNFSLLTEMADKYGFKTFRIPKVTLEGETVSSTNIRKYVENGEIKKANRLLGRAYAVEGVVVRGDGLARELGCPTANINCRNELMPPSGVYATRTKVCGKTLESVTYFGYRPTFSGVDMYRVETHIFDFCENLYGLECEVELLKKIRGDMRFNNVEDLKNQIQKDIEVTKELFTNGEL